jgi:hypothetical protein
VTLEIVGHLALALHSQIGFGIAALSSPLFARGPFDDGDLGPGLGGRHRRGKTRRPAAGDYNIKVPAFHSRLHL